MHKYGERLEAVGYSLLKIKVLPAKLHVTSILCSSCPSRYHTHRGVKEKEDLDLVVVRKRKQQPSLNTHLFMNSRNPSCVVLAKR